jgi:Carboxypeptidase regulatory-like domain
MKRQRLLSSRFVLALGAILGIAFLYGAVFAQTATSSVRGTVKDPQGNVVVGATVTLSNSSTGFSRTTTSNDAGQFSFEAISPGVYRAEVEAKNFKKASVTDIQALVSKPTDLTVQLEIGAVTETVSVQAGASEALLNTQDGSLGNNFVSHQISQLPLNARNVAGLLSLQPAVTPSGYVAGGRSDQANLTLDGVDVNEQQTGDAFTPVLRVSPDTVEEFRVTTTNPNASQGRSSGAQVELVTKSGTNQWHGNLFEYHRNTIFTANDFFNNRTVDPKTGKSLPRPTLLRNNYGGSLSGPIKKDKLFFFYNYEARQDARQGTINRLVPLASLGQGLLKFKTSNGATVTLTTAQLNALTTNGLASGTPLVDVNPVTVGILANAASKYVSNNTDLGDGLNTGGFRFNAPLPVKLTAHVARLDYNMTAHQVLFFRGNYQQDVTGGAPNFPDTPATNTWSHPLGFVIGHAWTISDHKINNLKFGLTREAFTNQGDSADNAITFRSVLSTSLFTRAFSRTTPVENITDDFTWIRGNHTFGFGGNVRIVRNDRTDFGPAFDSGITNQSFYAQSGAVLSNPINAWLPTLTGLPAGTTIASSSLTNTRHAYAALIGRLSQYTANFSFGTDGKPLAAGAPKHRIFATEEYDVYGQDSWKLRHNLTLNLGLRYGLSRPVYETQGFEAKPTQSLQSYFDKRVASAKQGINFTDPITVVLAGPANNAPGFYSMDTNNFQPRISVAWSPGYKHGFLAKLFGAEEQSVFRGGLAITNDYFGQALAVNFDTNNTLGFSSNQTPSANTYNVTTAPGPIITGLGMPIRNLPGIAVPPDLKFPQTQPQDFQRRIEGSLDSNLVSPINYSWNVTYGRDLPKGITVEASYIGHLARHLLATRDVMQISNIVDPKSGQDWYTAANILEAYRVARTPVANIPKIPFFENMYAPGSLDALLFGAGLSNTQAAYGFMAVTSVTPGCAGSPLFGCYDSGDDWTFLQDTFDANVKKLFFQSQYGALSAYGTIASSDYHGGSISIRQRFKGLTWDLNYTLSKSIDDASGLQTSGVYGSAFITNALRQEDNRAVSDFDVRHVVNFNSIWELPFGRGRTFFKSANKVVDAFIGGWQLTSIFRYNSGLPTSSPVDVGGWPTNWNVRSWATAIKPVETSPTRGGGTVSPNLFSDPKAFYQSFRSPSPGETGSRNLIRYPGFVDLDAGLYKTFSLTEKVKLTARWEVFNVSNTQHLTGNADVTNGLDPQFGSPTATFYNFTSIQGTPRVMQFALRLDF